MDEAIGTTNSQVIDATTSVLAMTAGHSPAQSFAMLDTVLLESLGMAMYNAVNRQQSASMLSTAAVTAACAKMLGVPYPMPAPPAFSPPPAPNVSPLPGPGSNGTDTSSAVDIFAKAQKDVNALVNLRSEAQSTVTSVNSDLQGIAKQISDAPASTTPHAASAGDTPSTPTEHPGGSGT